MNRISHRFYSYSSLEKLAQQFCVVPDPLESFEAWERLEHRDLLSLTEVELRQELAVLRLWLPLQASQDPWFLERVANLKGCLRHAE